jgi:hypothetical protein
VMTRTIPSSNSKLPATSQKIIRFWGIIYLKRLVESS